MSVSNSSDNSWWRVPYFRSKIPILPSRTRVPQDRCAYTCMPWPLKTFPVCEKTQWEKTTIGGGKRYNVNVIWYPDVWQRSNIFLILWHSGEFLPELLKLLRTIVQVLKRLPCVFKLCAACPPHSILYHSIDSAWVDNFLDFPNLFLILIHV